MSIFDYSGLTLKFQRNPLALDIISSYTGGDRKNGDGGKYWIPDRSLSPNVVAGGTEELGTERELGTGNCATVGTAELCHGTVPGHRTAQN